MIWIKLKNIMKVYCLEAYYTINSKLGERKIGVYCNGDKKTGYISPEGIDLNNYDRLYFWINIPILSNENEILIRYNNISRKKPIFEGFAFNINTWGFISNNGFSFVNNLNGEKLQRGKYKNGNCEYFIKNHNFFTINVPIVANNKDKLFFIVFNKINHELNLNTNITIGNFSIEKIRKSYNNPFSRYFNSLPLKIYYAAKIPKEIINKYDNFIKIKFGKFPFGSRLIFSEAGTHDFSP